MIRSATRRLEKNGVDSPQLSARILAQKVLGLDTLGLVMRSGDEVSPAHYEEYESLVKRRACGEPAAYILCEREFFGLDFEVGPDVLIPRPETEELVELVQKYYPADLEFLFADFGTGSGILAVTLATLFPKARGIAIDISMGACMTAYRNAFRHNVADRIQFIRADFTTSIIKNASLDLVVANPPYLSESELKEVSREVSDFEPCHALVGGTRGDELISGCAPVIAKALKKGSMMFMEIGYLQGQSVKNIFELCEQNYTDVRIAKDLSGHDRIAVAKRQ